MRTGRRRGATVISTLVVLAAACSTSGDDASDPIDVGSLRLGGVDLIGDDVVAFQSAISPDGRSIVSVDVTGGDGGVCVETIDVDRPSGCVSIGGPLVLESAGWSGDGTLVFVHAAFFRSLDEPDLVRIDVANGDVDVVTDDRVDELPFGDDSAGSDALVDVSPSVTEDGGLVFLRRSGREAGYELHRVAADQVAADGEAFATAVESVGSLELPGGVTPISGLRSAGGDRWVVLGLDLDELGDPTLFMIDAGDETVDGDEVRVADRGASVQLVDVSPSHALLADLESLQRLDTSAADDVLTLVDLASGDSEPVGLDVTDSLPLGAALSPDGSALAVVLAGFDEDAEPELLALSVDESGVGDPVSIDLPPELRDRRLFGFGNTIQMGWTDDDRLVLGADDRIAVVQVLTDG